MRILFMVNAFVPDAPTRMMLAVARACQAEGWGVEVAAAHRGGPLAESIQQQFGSAQVYHARGLRMVGAWQHLLSHIHASKHDILHSTLVRPTLFAGETMLRGRPSTKFIVTQNGVHEMTECRVPAGLMTSAYWRAVEPASRIVAVSDAVRRDLIGAGFRGEQIVTIPNGIDVVAPPENPTKSRSEVLRRFVSDANEDTCVILSAGNLRKVKGHDILIAAFAKALNVQPNLRLILAGDGPQRRFLQRLAARHKIMHAVVFAGHVDDPAPLFAACDIYVQPSRYEAFGLSVAEAMAAGRPVVASRVGGLPELVVHDTTGLLVDPEDSDSMSAAILQLAGDSELRSAFGQAAAARISQKFTEEQMTRNYLSLYHQVVGA